MPQSLTQVWLHLVFSTKDRQPMLESKFAREQMFRMLSHHVRETGCHPKVAGGTSDHAHVLCGLSRTLSIWKSIEVIKSETSKWIKKPPHSITDFGWQAGYGAFSVSQSNLESVIQYIENQEEHHKRMSFQDEFRQLCLKHGIEIDERYVWD